MILALALLVVGLGACGGGAGADAPSTPATAGATGAAASGGRSHVFVIVLENHEYGQVMGNPDARFINHLAGRAALATRYYAVSHPSLPNYLAMIGGATFGIRSDCTQCQVSGPSLPKQLSDSGVDWRAYMQGMPRSCFQGGSSGDYAKKHNPFYYFPQVTSDPALCDRVVPGGRLESDLRNDSLPTFGWLTPDLCNDAHDCSIARSDGYLSRVVPQLLRRVGPHGFLVLTFDEGVSGAGCCGATGGRVATIVAGPDVRARTRLTDSYTHYSLLATIENAFRLPLLRKARTASPLRAAFTRAPNLSQGG